MGRGERSFSLGRSRWPNLWCADRLGHAVEDRNALAAAAGRKRFGRRAEAAVDVLPVVHHPDIPGWVDGEGTFRSA
jgi:hypothetical protein